LSSFEFARLGKQYIQQGNTGTGGSNRVGVLVFVEPIVFDVGVRGTVRRWARTEKPKDRMDCSNRAVFAIYFTHF